MGSLFSCRSLLAALLATGASALPAHADATSEGVARATEIIETHRKPPVYKPAGDAFDIQAVAKGKTAPAAATTNGAAKGKDASKKSGRAGRPKKKTAEELDTEMDDYFGEGTAANGTAQPAAANGGDAMVDEVL